MTDASRKRKSFPSQEPAANRRRYEKYKASGNQKPTGVLRYTCRDDEEKCLIQADIDRVREIMNSGQSNLVSNEMLLKSILKYFIHGNTATCTTPVSSSDRTHGSQATANISYASSFCGKGKAGELMFVTSESAITQLLSEKSNHICGPLHVQTVNLKGHVAMYELCCQQCSYKTRWNSSPYLSATGSENPKFLVNLRMAHSYLSSGLREVQYQTLCNGANIGLLSTEYIARLREKYKGVVDTACKKSQMDSIIEEIASTEKLMDGIEVMTDARHGTRKNAKDTDVICLGDSTHKCLWNGHITRRINSCTQRHELLGTKRMYNFFDNMDVPIARHTHDDNRSVSKFVEDERPDTTNSIDVWH